MVRGKSTLGRRSGAFPPVRPLACLPKHISSVYWQARTFPILLFQTVIGKIWGRSLSIEGEVYPHPPHLPVDWTLTVHIRTSCHLLFRVWMADETCDRWNIALKIYWPWWCAWLSQDSVCYAFDGLHCLPSVAPTWSAVLTTLLCGGMSVRNQCFRVWSW